LADGILLERNGMPAVSICTEPFRVTADAVAKAYGVPGFDYVLTGHPVANLSADEIGARAEEIVSRALEILGVDGHD
jgi:hypothetical protein